MKKKILYICILLATTAITGCSTITQSDMQTISLTTTYKGTAVEADCELSNDKGVYKSKTPSNVSVHKSGENLNVTCKKEGLPDGLLVAISRAAGSMWGNILIGGGVGAIIDHSRGNGYDYPNLLAVKMGESSIADKKAENATQASSNQMSDQNDEFSN